MTRRVRLNGATKRDDSDRPVLRTRVNSDDLASEDYTPTMRTRADSAALGFLGGRPIGAQSHMTKRLKDAIYAAGEEVGFDGKGTGGMQGYLKRLAIHDVPSYVSLAESGPSRTVIPADCGQRSGDRGQSLTNVQA